MKSFIYTCFALVAFAFNSILCRLALGNQAIDAASFTAIRLVSGAIMLMIISLIFSKDEGKLKGGNWFSAFFLFAYAISFSFAYINLTAGTGALILFGTVQTTMITAALISGERPRALEWVGILLAFGGLIYLVFPGLAAPPLLNSILMIIAGISWGFYTFRGCGSKNPLANTTGNFIRAVPMIILAGLPFISQTHLSQKGILLAILSGAIASGIGYAVWYTALKSHTATRAALLQLCVPALAAFGGTVLLSEIVSWRLLFAGALILGGIGLAIWGRKKHSFNYVSNLFRKTRQKSITPGD